MPEPISLVILGAAGRLGATLAEWLSGHCHVLALKRTDCDVTDFPRLTRFFDEWENLGVKAVINASGITHLETAESYPEVAWLVNAEAPGFLARECARRGIRFAHFSTDYVFNGRDHTPLKEEDEPAPLSLYAHSKLEGEKHVLAAGGQHLVWRVSWVLGAGKPAFPDQVLRGALGQQEVSAVADKWSSPTNSWDVARWLLPWLHGKVSACGLFHVCSQGACTWHDLATTSLEWAVETGMLKTLPPVKPLRMADVPAFKARRPVYSVMSTEKLQRVFHVEPPLWRDALRDYLRRRWQGQPV